MNRECELQAALRDYDDLLTRPLIAPLATVRPDGSPQVNPVWLRWDGNDLWMTMTTTRQRYRNIASHPTVAISIVDPDDPYRYLAVRGRIERMDADPEATEFLRLANRYGLAVDVPRDAPMRLAVAIQPTAASHQRGLPRSLRDRRM
jgi:PPOX class probable F420-dependent enzyme